jgi:autotransporter translocation and assembly factor TamB
VSPRPRWRRVARWTALGAGGLIILTALALAGAATFLQGERLGSLLAKVLPELAGRLEVRSVRWSPRALLALLTDARTPIVVEGVKVWDPEGTLVLESPRVEVKVQPRSAIEGRVFLHDLNVAPGSFWRFAAMKRSEDVGFLAALQPKGSAPSPSPRGPDGGAPPPRPEPPAEEGTFLFQIVNADLQGLTALFDFPGVWGLELRDTKGTASFVLDGDFVGWDAPNLDARGGGYLRVLEDVLPCDRVHVRRVATLRDRPNDIFLDVAGARTGRATLVGRGHFTGIYGYRGDTTPPGIDLHVEFSEAADALAAVAAQRGIPGLRIGGRGARVVADLRDEFAQLQIAGRVTGLDVAFGSYEARGLRIGFDVNLGAPMTLDLKELAFNAPGGGRFALDAALKDTAFRARLRLDRFTTDSYLPQGLRPSAAGKVSGQLRVSGDFGPKKRATVSALDFTLARTRKGPLPRTLRVRGQAAANANGVATEGVTIEAPGTTVALQGRYSIARKLVGLALRATATDLPELLATFGLPPVARGAALSVDVDGTIDRPRARGELVVRGVRVGGGFPELPEVKAQFGLTDGTAHLDSLSAGVFGGTVDARGKVALWRGTWDRMLRTPVVDLRVEGRKLDLGSLFGYSVIHGRIDFDAEAKGPVDRLTGRLTLPAGAELGLFGDQWIVDGVDVEVDATAVVVRFARLRRDTGARIEAQGRYAFSGEMGWTVNVRDVALEGIPGLKQTGGAVTGRLSAELTGGGTIERPLLRGTIDLEGVTARGAALGDGRIAIGPSAEGGLSVTGDLFGRLKLAAVAAFTPEGPHVKGGLEFDKLVLEDFLPELVALGDGKGRVSGRLGIELGPRVPLTAEAVLTELALSVSRQVGTGPSARPAQRLSVRNGGPVRVVVVGDRVTVHDTRLLTDGGEFKLRGALAGDAISGQVSGFLNLELLQPFLPPPIQTLAGDVRVQLKAGGTLSHPEAEGGLAIASPVRMRFDGFEPEILVPSGAVRLTPGAVRLDDLAVTVDEATMTLRGQTTFDERFALQTVGLDAQGEVSARLLALVAPEAVTEASGRARIQAHLAGATEAPDAAVRVDLKGVDIRLRGLDRELSLGSGIIELSPRELSLRNVRALVDGQGVLRIDAGTVAVKSFAITESGPEIELGAIRLPLRGERLSYSDGAVELADLGFDLTLAGASPDALSLGGEVRIASGRYVRDFTVRNLVISPNINESSTTPFYEGQPWLESLGLDLRVRTIGDSFVVQNNLAPEIHMVLDLHVGGTLPAPQIAGGVRPTDGRFHIPGIRGDFDLVPNVNHITFVSTKSIDEGDTPELFLEAENSVTDSVGRDHDVRVRISGPIGQMRMDLLSTGLDRNQTMVLLLSGRTTEQTFQTTNATFGSNVRTGTDVVGQITRDSVANLVEPYIDDTLELLTGRKIHLRPTIGADGFELRLGARLSRQLDLNLSFLGGFLGQRRYRAESSVWLMDYLTLRGVGEQNTLVPNQGVVEDFSSLRLELSIDYPIRLLRR